MLEWLVRDAFNPALPTWLRVFGHRVRDELLGGFRLHLAQYLPDE
jgi:hypothetical protein